MCLAIPAEIIKQLPNHRAIVNLGGVEKEISLDLVDNVTVGDFVVVHVGYALSKLNQDEAKKTLSLLQQMLEEYEQEGQS